MTGLRIADCGLRIGRTDNPKSKIPRPAGHESRGGQNPKFLSKVLRFDEQGLIPAVIQDAKTKQVLTLCYLNRRALRKSLETGTVYVFRRSQNRMMQKGETSGHIQAIREVRVDCEGKSLLLLVRQRVAACHAGYFTCYFRRLSKSGRVATVGRRIFNPMTVYRTS